MNTAPTILITGANGQLGSELKVLSQTLPQYNFLFADRQHLPIDNSSAVEDYFRRHPIDFCINCAAYTAVDKAESDRDKAFAVNATAVEFLAKQSLSHSVKLIHISTDYVYGGMGSTPLKEDAPTQPVNIYGESKLAGEQLAMKNNPEVIIVRTSWLYSSFGNNFLKTMMRLLHEREEVRVINDQKGTPTYAAHLAESLLSVVDKIEEGEDVKGIYNFSNSGYTTWYGFAKKIAEIKNSNCRVVPISTTEYPTPAARPKYSVLDTTKIKQLIRQEIPGWEKGVLDCIDYMR